MKYEDTLLVVHCPVIILQKSGFFSVMDSSVYEAFLEAVSCDREIVAFASYNHSDAWPEMRRLSETYDVDIFFFEETHMSVKQFISDHCGLIERVNSRAYVEVRSCHLLTIKSDGLHVMDFDDHIESYSCKVKKISSDTFSSIKHPRILGEGL